MNRLLCAISTVAVVIGTAELTQAQYPPYNPYYNPPVNYNFGPGATLSGGAQVIQATGELYIQQEQARQQREKYNQDKLTTKKMAFDQANYERANTRAPTENQARVLNLQVQRVITQANPAEIKRGDTLNTLMPYIKAMSDQGVPGPPLSINPSLLKSINVKVGTAGAAPGAGLLKDGGRLSWPLVLRGPRQKELDKLLPPACSEAAAGTLELPQYNKVVAEVQLMKEDLRKQYHTEKISGSSFLAGDGYLESLVSSLKVLERPDAAMFFNGGYTARGSNVPELIDNMIGQGLTFGPATPGFEAPYFALHNAFVSYARAAQSAAGFQPTSLR